MEGHYPLWPRINEEILVPFTFNYIANTAFGSGVRDGGKGTVVLVGLKRKDKYYA